MKTKHLVTAIICIAIQSFSSANQQEPDSLGLQGDNFDLSGVLELFKNSDNTEELEKAINSNKNNVNNLDLNDDGKIDYVKATDYQKDNGRAIVFQVDVSESESQDIAVIEIDKTGEESATAQIIGDEELYGDKYIVEPIADEASISTLHTPIIVNVWKWRPLRYYYGPKYVVRVAPWRWAYYPVWFAPWTPVPWHVHHKRVIVYHRHCGRVYIHRAPHIKVVYHPHRKTSKVVHAHRAANKGAVNNGSRKNVKENHSKNDRGKAKDNQQRGGKKNGGAKKAGGQKQNGGGRGGAGGGKQGGGKKGR